jgi:hypothetical protein
MVQASGKGRQADSEVIPVPFENRPQIGAHPIAFQTVHQRAQVAWTTAVEGADELVFKFVSEMARLGAADRPDLTPDECRLIMWIANDVRGIGPMIGSSLIADIADVIFTLSERLSAKDVLSKRLVALLAQSGLQLLRREPSENPDELHRQIHAMLGDIRAKLNDASPLHAQQS